MCYYMEPRLISGGVDLLVSTRLPFLPAPRCIPLLRFHSSRPPQCILQRPPKKTDHDALCGQLLACPPSASCSSSFGSLSTRLTVQPPFSPFASRPWTLRRPRSPY